MKYQKPTLLLVDTALAAIQSHTGKEIVPAADSQKLMSNAAYEADE